MTDPVPSADDAALQRRRFLRGGALLAAAAGGAVAASASSALPAAAAPVEYVRLGAENTASAATVISSGAESATTLALRPAAGAALELASNEFPALAVNQIAGTSEGLVVGVKYPDDDTVYTDYLATSSDVSALPVTYPVPPHRILDTKAKNTKAVVASSSSPFDKDRRLKKGAWIDVVVEADVDDYSPIAAHVVVTSTGSSSDGYLTVYVPSLPRTGVTVSFLKKKQLSGSAYAGLDDVKGKRAFRIYASQATHVAVDLTGITDVYDPVLSGADAGARSGGKVAAKPSRAAAARRLG